MKKDPAAQNQTPERVKTSAADIAVNIVSLAALIALAIYLIVGWQGFPDLVPAHYGFFGEPDRWEPKSSLLVLPIVGGCLYILLSVVEMFPRVWNTGTKEVTAENRERVWRILKNMLVSIKLVIVLLFAVLSIFQTLAVPLPAMLIAAGILIIFGSIAFWIIRLNRI